MHMFRVCAVGVGGPRSIGAAVRAVPLPSSSSRMIISIIIYYIIKGVLKEATTFTERV